MKLDQRQALFAVKLLSGCLFVALLAGGLWFFDVQENVMRQKVEQDLQAIVQLKVSQLVSWRNDQLDDAAKLPEDPFLFENIVRLLKGADERASRDLDIRFRALADQHDFSDILLVDPTGEIRASLSKSGRHLDGLAALLAEALEDRRPVMANLHRDPTEEGSYISVAAPIVSGAGTDASPLGALVLVSKAEQFLYPLLRFWPTPSSTAESLLVQRDGDHVLFLNELRHRHDTALQLRIPLSEKNVPAVMAALGKEGFFSGTDYRGVEVVSVIMAIPDSPWLMIGKIDKVEAYSEWNFRLVLMLSLLLGVTLLAGVSWLVLWQSERKAHYRELYRAETVLRAQAERHSITLQAIGDAVIATDACGLIELLNPVAEALTGWTNDAARNRPLEEVFSTIIEGSRQKGENPVAKVLREGRVVGLASRTLLISRDGTERLIADSGAPIRSADGQITGVVLVFRDQSTENAAQKALQHNEERLRLVLEATSEAFWDWDLRTGMIYRSPHFYTLVARQPAEDSMDLQFLQTTVHQDDLPTVVANISAYRRGETPAIEVDFRLASADGAARWLRIEGKAVEWATDGAPLRIVGTLFDITTAKNSEEELRSSRSTLAAALASMTDAVLITDRNGKRVEFNDAFASFHRFTSRAECLEKVDNFSAIFEVSRETGETVPTESWSLPRALRGETVTNAEYRLRRKDTGESWVGSYSFGPIRDKDGVIVGAVVVGRDITELKKNEEARLHLESQLQQVQKMEAVGQLAGGVAHDFNNMLGVILGHAELAMEKMTLADPLLPHLQEIASAAERSAGITRQLLAFARKQTIMPKVIDLNSTVEGMLKMLRRLIGEDIDLVWIPGFELWQIKADPSQIDQLLANLCVNARDAIPGVGRIAVVTENVSFDEAFCHGDADLLPGDYVMLAVSDTGRGMDKEILARIFEPFYTTKNIGEGTGLGLAMVYGAVKQNNGFINVASEPGQGTTFKIYLPRLASGAEMAQEAAGARLAEGGNESILLVEDEPTILRMTSAMLESLGYSVMAIDTPGAAVQLGRDYHQQVQLLITDVIMPEMNGFELAEIIRAQQPGIRCLFMSGYTADIISRQGVLLDGIQFIQKPFTRQSLAAKIREVLADTTMGNSGGLS